LTLVSVFLFVGFGFVLYTSEGLYGGKGDGDGEGGMGGRGVWVLASFVVLYSLSN